MQPRTPLFRPAALAANRAEVFGDIVLVRPLSFGVLIGAAFAAACAIAALFVFGTYTRHSTLRGRLMPDLGVIEVHTPQYGTIVEKRVAEGQAVMRGDVLFVVSSERLSSARGETQELIGEQLERRRGSLETQIQNLRAREQADRGSLAQRLSMLEAEITYLTAMIAGQQQRVAMAEEAAARYERVQAHGFVSKDQLLVKHEELIDQRSRTQSLERERSNVARQLTDLENQLSGLRSTYQGQIAELERAIAGTELDMTENEARRRVLIVAPQDGTATAVVGDAGQVVDGSAALAFIVPAGAVLQAQLYAPSRAVGFVGVGDEVLLRYPAFPYQKFGHQRGTVAAVSRIALSAAGALEAAPAASAEPVYRIIVELGSQTVTAYGEPRALRAGMLIEADVLQERRRLYEWALEPLYTLTGKIH
jgi:membrane fusion protein